MITLTNIERLAPEAQKETRSYAERLLEILGDNAVCVAVYGSATGGDFVPRRSDINLLVVVKELELPVLRSVLPLTARGGKGPVATPLFLSQEYMARSRDVFPIELLELRENHVVLHGEDLLSAIEVEAEDVRLECEREIRGSLVRLRQAYLEVGKSRREMEQLLHQSLTSLIPVFRSLVGFRDRGRPRRRDEVLRLLGETFEIDPAPLLAINRDRQGDEKIGNQDVEVVFEQYLRELGRLARAVDHLRREGES